MKTIRKTLLCGAAALALSAGTIATPANADGHMSHWEGWYAGVMAGAAIADFDGVHQGNNADNEIVSPTDGDSFVGGLYVGYNHRRNGYVYGIEADILFANIDTYTTSSGITSTSSSQGAIADSVDLLISVRGRLGYMAHDNLLVYGTAGVAWVDAEHAVFNLDNTADQGSVSLDSFGGVVGGGAEWAINDTWSMRGQALYYFFDASENTNALGVGENDTGDFGALDGAFSVTIGLTANLSNLMGPR